MSTASVAIIGGGPAGCAAAASAIGAMGGANAKVVVFESGTPGHKKTCAGGLTPDCVKEISQCDIDESALRQIGGHPFRKIIVHHDGRGAFEFDVGLMPGWVVPRYALDQKLRDAAASTCQVEYGLHVMDIKRCRDKWQLSIRTRQKMILQEFDAVVLANGLTSRLSEKLSVDGRAVKAAAIMQYSSNHQLGEAVHFDFRQSLTPGYVWWFPMGASGANWGACILAEHRTEALSEFRSRMRRLSLLNGYTHPRTGVVGLWSGNGIRWHDPSGLLSAGDAAGLVDPYSGEGISAAILSGRHAGLHIAEYLGGDSKALTRYSDWIRCWFGTAYERHGPRAKIWQALLDSR